MTRTQAEEKVIKTEAMNPGRKFKVVEVQYMNGETGFDVSPEKATVAELKESVRIEVSKLGALSCKGVRTHDFPRYDAQQQKVADAKKALRIALGIQEVK